MHNYAIKHRVYLCASLSAADPGGPRRTVVEAAGRRGQTISGQGGRLPEAAQLPQLRVGCASGVPEKTADLADTIGGGTALCRN